MLAQLTDRFRVWQELIWTRTMGAAQAVAALLGNLDKAVRWFVPERDKALIPEWPWWVWAMAAAVLAFVVSTERILELERLRKPRVRLAFDESLQGLYFKETPASGYTERLFRLGIVVQGAEKADVRVVCEKVSDRLDDTFLGHGLAVMGVFAEGEKRVERVTVDPSDDGEPRAYVDAVAEHIYTDGRPSDLMLITATYGARRIGSAADEHRIVLRVDGAGTARQELHLVRNQKTGRLWVRLGDPVLSDSLVSACS